MSGLNACSVVLGFRGEHAGDDGGLRVARAESVDVDAMWCAVERSAFREAQDRVLGSDVGAWRGLVGDRGRRRG